MANGSFMGWNSSFLRGFGKLKLLYVYISEDSLFLVFNKKAVITGITGISLTSDATALSVVSVVSGSGTSSITLQLNRLADVSETIFLNINSINDIIGYRGIADYLMKFTDSIIYGTDSLIYGTDSLIY